MGNAAISCRQTRSGLYAFHTFCSHIHSPDRRYSSDCQGSFVSEPRPYCRITRREYKDNVPESSNFAVIGSRIPYPVNHGNRCCLSCHRPKAKNAIDQSSVLCCQFSSRNLRLKMSDLTQSHRATEVGKRGDYALADGFGPSGESASVQSAFIGGSRSVSHGSLAESRIPTFGSTRGIA